MIEPTPAFELDGITLRWRKPVQPPGASEPHRLVVMLHGWTGDEDVMWIFAGKLPAKAWLVAPRALHPASPSGYSWTPKRSSADGLPTLDEFRPAAARLLNWLTPANFPGAEVNRFDLVGFSQGAALAFSLALLHPQRVRSVAALSGFLPRQADALIAQRPLAGLPVFLAHGSNDDIVPVDEARRAAEALDSAGAQVSYCEDAVGHKLSATCFRSLADFYAL